MSTIEQRFFDKTEWSVDLFEGTPCLLWTKSLYPEGYGQAWDGERRILAHRWAWIHAFGPPPERDEDGNRLVLDHRCHVADGRCPGGRMCLHRRCVNLSHLDLVTQRENILRGLAPSALISQARVCGSSHSLTTDNVYVLKSGSSRCKACQRGYRLESRRRARGGT